jgi:hypothetical protein
MKAMTHTPQSTPFVCKGLLWKKCKCEERQGDGWFITYSNRRGEPLLTVCANVGIVPVRPSHVR